MSDPPPDNILQDRFRSQIQDHPMFRIYFEWYNNDLEPGDPKRSYRAILIRLEKLFEKEVDDKQRQELGLGVVGRVPGQAGGKAAAGISERDGICNVWKRTGYCARMSEKGHCEFSHPLNAQGIDKGKGKGKAKKGKGKDGKGKGKDGTKGKDGKGKNLPRPPRPDVNAEPRPPKKAAASKELNSKILFTTLDGQWCKSHTKAGECTDPNECKQVHNATCKHWLNRNDGDGCPMPKGKCAFPHRSDVIAAVPKGATKSSDGKLQLPAKKIAAQKAALSIHLAEGSDSEHGQ
jgi:hypothetical protein